MRVTTATTQSETLVWSSDVRLFHWSLVILVSLLWLTAQFHRMELHLWLGYALLLLLSSRLLLGFWGQGYARFASFIFSISETSSYIKGLRQKNAPRYLGHNPLGALMVFTLLGLLFIQAFLGITIEGVVDFDGPLQGLGVIFSDELSYLLLESHEAIQYLLAGLVVLHVAGVIVSSRDHQENLLLAMITGRKKSL